jgi:hypothetical protein
MQQAAAKVQSDRVTGVSNVAYDLMVVLSNHLQAIAAMEGYKLDAEAADDTEVRDVFDRIVERQRQGVDELRGLLVSRLQ